ncbi:MAG: HAD family hydrolase [Sphingomonadales bacterium]|nr:HAD family hydrolase [Sphingomonadales bacterium]
MQLKLVIWDLDDTLWRGALADGDDVVPDQRRAELVRAFNAKGVVSSICSNNDPAAARARLEALGLWDQFVFPRIAFAPKPEAIRAIIDDMQLRPANVLFVDDNPHNLAGARHLLPDLHVLDARAADADDTLAALLAGLPANGRSRLAEYRQLEAKAADRAAGGGSNEDFLHACNIQATAPFLMDNLDFVERIAELVNRANQLNYTGTRFEPAALTTAIVDVVAHDSWSIFAWDRYGDYGLVGFVQVDRKAKRLIHFAFSCRIMHMGIEQYALARVLEKWPDCDLSVLAGRVAATPAPWVHDQSFHEPAVRERLIARLNPAAAGPRDVRVMFDCQSGGIAHFSAHRDRIDFDNAPRLFALRHVIPNSGEDLRLAPRMVYGAGIDYSDPRWPELADLIDDGLYEACADLLCAHVNDNGARLLVLLPVEDAAEERYRPHMGHTRDRTIRFNRVWRALAARHPGIDLFDMTGFARADDMTDVSHYHARFLRRLAGEVDRWLAAA